MSARSLKHGRAALTAAGGLVYATRAAAVCPVCTVAVATGVGLSRWLGVDDSISGLWVGDFSMALALWAYDWLAAREVAGTMVALLVTIVSFGLSLLGLYFGDALGNPDNALWGVDKLLLGMAVGGLSFFAGARIYGAVKTARGGHAHFPFEKVVLPIAPLLILSGVFYFLLR
jgi:hypothetical protein